MDLLLPLQLPPPSLVVLVYAVRTASLRGGHSFLLQVTSSILRIVFSSSTATTFLKALLTCFGLRPRYSNDLITVGIVSAPSCSFVGFAVSLP